jgi:hypothetical protein
MAPRFNMEELKKFQNKLKKNCCQKTEFKMAGKFKTKFAYVAKKTLIRHIEYGRHLEFLRICFFIKVRYLDNL